MFSDVENSSPASVRAQLPTIIYASRTHSQLTQVIKELKNTEYSPKTTILGSRNQMCIHPVVKNARGTAQNLMCRAFTNQKRCNFQDPVKAYAQHSILEPIKDIEDLVKEGSENGVCPYYLAKELQTSAIIVFMPYNYIVDPMIRQTLTVDLNGAVIIFDEAHNLESICSEASSFELTTKMLDDGIRDVQHLLGSIIEGGEHNPKEINKLKDALQQFKEWIELQTLNTDGLSLSGSHIYDVLDKCLSQFQSRWDAIELIEKAMSAMYLEDSSSAWRSSSLNTLASCLKLLFQEGLTRDQMTDFYKVHIEMYTPQTSWSRKGLQKNYTKDRKLSVWCFNPGLAMLAIQNHGIRNMILTSGTLSPLDSFASELSLRCPLRLENPHIISDEQVWVGVLSNGPDGTPLNSSYENRNSKTYVSSLGNTIFNIVQRVPDGVLVFFPSYSLLETCLADWKQSNIWSNICKYKLPVEEPRQGEKLSHAIEDFYAKLDSNESSGAIFFAVCRGKVSEGIDFANRNGRAVVITGLPYPLLSDPKVKLKRKYLDSKSIQNNRIKVLNGSEWYKQCATRAVNQAVGRVIRHRWDYGAIILADERFTRHKQELSLWLRPHIHVYSKFGQAVGSLIKFFKSLKGFGDTDLNTTVVDTFGTIDIQGEIERNNRTRPSVFDQVRKLRTEKLEMENFQKEEKLIKPEPEPQTPISLFLVELHESLTVEEFEIFRHILQTYRQNRDNETMMYHVQQILSTSESKIPLMYKFVPFLPAALRQPFMERIETLIKGQTWKSPSEPDNIRKTEKMNTLLISDNQERFMMDPDVAEADSLPLLKKRRFLTAATSATNTITSTTTTATNTTITSTPTTTATNTTIISTPTTTATNTITSTPTTTATNTTITSTDQKLWELNTKPEMTGNGLVRESGEGYVRGRMLKRQLDHGSGENERDENESDGIGFNILKEKCHTGRQLVNIWNPNCLDIVKQPKTSHQKGEVSTLPFFICKELVKAPQQECKNGGCLESDKRL